MLSRLAESLFWIGRHVERAEGTSRILDVQTQLILEDPTVDEEQTCRAVLAIMGIPADSDDEIDAAEMLRRLAYDPGCPTSIAASLVAAREGARRARERLSTSLWEVVNTTYRTIPSGAFVSNPRLFPWVRERASLINGTADSTMLRDEGWHFMVLGRSIERADMTARLVASAAVASGDAWTTTLRACGGHEAFLRTHGGVVTDSGAAEFLLRDRLFPRSVVSALYRAEQCLVDLEAAGGRIGVRGEPERLLGRIRAELEYRTLNDLLLDLPSGMEQLQRSCVAATNAITTRYFAGAEARHWRGGLPMGVH
jgi:uncharacterized alpha-E superfamily protein